MVQTRGGWSSSAALDKYYDRLHEFQNWPSILASGENVGVRQSTSCLVRPSLASGAEPRARPEGGSLEAETRRTRQLVDCLWARGARLTVRFRSCGWVGKGNGTHGRTGALVRAWTQCGPPENRAHTYSPGKTVGRFHLHTLQGHPGRAYSNDCPVLTPGAAPKSRPRDQVCPLLTPNWPRPFGHASPKSRNGWIRWSKGKCVPMSI